MEITTFALTLYRPPTAELADNTPRVAGSAGLLDAEMYNGQITEAQSE
jgi:hypothetical protein